MDMKKFRLIAMLVISAILCISCGDRKKALLPNVSGKAGEVLVVIGQSEWEGALGTAIRDTLTSDCPFLPQREPLYSVVNIVPTAFTNIFQIHRNILICNVNPHISEPGVRFLNDVWARPQCVIKIEAIDEPSAVQLFEDNKVKITTMLEQAERNRVIANSIQYEEKGIRPVLEERFGGFLHFPVGYAVRKAAEDFVWVAYETQYTNQGVFVYKYPAGENPFTEEALVSKRNEFLKNYVPGMFDNTYMITSPIIDPSVKYLKYQGQDFAEMRGYWEVYGDYMGGPFVSHSFYSPDGKWIVTLDSFVYAPKYDKRHYLRQVESLLYSWEWNDETLKK